MVLGADEHNITVNYSKTVDILKSTNYHNPMNASANVSASVASDDADNPFFAFNGITLTPGVYDYVGMQYETKSKDITDPPPTDDCGLLMTSDEKRQLKAKYPVLS